MLLAGGSFTLYYRALKRDPKPLLRSSEFKVYLLVVAGITLWAFVASGNDGGQAAGFRDALVHHRVDGDHHRLRHHRVRPVEPDDAVGAAVGDADRCDGRLDGRRRQAGAGDGDRQLRPPRGAATPASASRSPGAGRQRHPARRRRPPGRRLHDPRARDLRWWGGADLGDRAGHDHVVVVVGDGVRQRRAGSRLARSRQRLPVDPRARAERSRWPRCCSAASRSIR